jgi:glycine/D-amino acid oxidase-like deaminating enzyme
MHLNRHKVIVVGSGIIGAAVAYKLASLGHHVTIIEELDGHMMSRGTGSSSAWYEPRLVDSSKGRLRSPATHL